MARPILVSAFMALFVSVVQLYTWVTLPIYFFSQKPWIRRAKSARNRVKLAVPSQSLNPNDAINEEEEEGTLSATYVRDYVIQKEHDIIKLDTVTEMLDRVVEVHGANNKALGMCKTAHLPAICSAKNQSEQLCLAKLSFWLIRILPFSYPQLTKKTSVNFVAATLAMTFAIVDYKF